MIAIPRTRPAKPRPCGDNEIRCVVCYQPVKTEDHPLWLWVHDGGAAAVTADEGKRLNADGGEGADLGLQPIGRACLKKHPELKPYLMPKGGQ